VSLHLFSTCETHADIHRLPFIDEANACLGIAAKTYLDELCNEPEPTSDDVKSKHMEKLREMIPQAIDIIGDLELGFRVWDGVRVLLSPPDRSLLTII
jgi:hypothetical protein